MKIPLHEQLLARRRDVARAGLLPPGKRLGMQLAALVLRSGCLYAARRARSCAARPRAPPRLLYGALERLGPPARAAPAAARESFRDLWRQTQERAPWLAGREILKRLARRRARRRPLPDPRARLARTRTRSRSSRSRCRPSRRCRVRVAGRGRARRGVRALAAELGAERGRLAPFRRPARGTSGRRRSPTRTQLEGIDLAVLPGAFGVAENGAVWVNAAALPPRGVFVVTAAPRARAPARARS